MDAENSSHHLEGSQEYVAIVDRDRRITWFNQPFINPDSGEVLNVLGRFCYEVFLQDSEPCDVCPLLEAMETGMPKRGKDIRRDGRISAIMGFPVMDESGDVTGAVLVFQRITHFEEQYRYLVENSPDIILEVDPDGKILYANRILTGLKKEEAVGTNLLDYIPKRHQSQVRKLLRRSIEKGRNTSYEFSVATSMGERWWSTRAIPMEREGAQIRFLLIIEDTTAQKRAEDSLRRSEEQYRKLIDNSPLPMFIHRDEEILFANTRLLKLMSAGDVKELLGRKIGDFVHADDREKANANLKIADSMPDEPFQAEYRIVNLKGDVFNVTFSGITVDFEGRPARLVILSDIRPARSN